MNYFLVLFFLITTTARAEINANFTSGTLFHTNVFYKNDGPVGDFLLRFMPSVDYLSGAQKFEVNLKTTAEYAKHLKYSELDFFDYNVSLESILNRENKLTLFLKGDIRKTSEPSIDLDEERLLRNIFNGQFKLRLKTSDISFWTTRIDYEMGLHSQTLYDHLNYSNISGALRYSYQILPETTIFFEGNGGSLSYPDGLSRSDDAERPDSKYSSLHFEGLFGTEGRLTETTLLEARVSYIFLIYNSSENFIEPTFGISFQEQLTPRDLLMLGYDYNANDSFFTNYELSQTIFVSYGRILADRVLLLSKGFYKATSFSLPRRREDQRVGGRMILEYSITPKSKINFELEVDLLNSDGRDVTGTLSDPAIGYNAIHTGLSYKRGF